MSEYKVEISSDNTITVGIPSTGNGVAGPRGEKGYSAYELAVKNGYTGTETEWLATLKGEKGEKGEPGTNGSDGKPGKDGVDGANGTDGKPGANGLSAYELAAKNGFTGNESAWLASLKGDKGPKGDDGQNGVNGVDGKDGLSAYSIAVKNGYSGTEEKWVNKWLRGTIVSASTDSAGNMVLTDINGNSVTTPLQPLVDAANSAQAAATSAGNAKASESHAASAETNAASYLAQSKVIKESVDSALTKVTGAMKYAGSVNTYADLPTTDRNAGDVYNVKTADPSHGIKAGENVAWNGTDWDPLGGTVDLSTYATKEDVKTAFVNVTYNNDSINFILKNGETTTVKVNNVAHAATSDSAVTDANGKPIISTYVTLIDFNAFAQNLESVWQQRLANKLDVDSTAQRAEADADGNNISSTYATKVEAGIPYQIKRNTAYKVGDVLTSPSLPPGCVIVVTQAGTTGNTEPDWATIKSNMGWVIADGTVKFYINDTLNKHSIGDIVYKPLTKVTEHEYLLPLDGQTIDGTTYKRLVDYLGTNVLPNLNGRYLRADTTPGTMVEAGLPNIMGKFGKVYSYHDQIVAEGAIAEEHYESSSHPYFDSQKEVSIIYSLDASRSSAVYGKSDTVTPLTYTVRAYICYA